MKNKDIRIITLYQPWATLLAHGIKKNETRPKSTTHTFEKGSYLIHAAKKWTKQQNDLCLTEPFKSNLENLGYPASLESHYASVNGLDGIVFPLGQIIGSFEVKECLYVHNREYDFDSLELKGAYLAELISNKISNLIIRNPELKFGDYSFGRSIWIGQNHRVLKNPIPYKGSQGYYAKFKGNINDLKFM